jgi:hypothetical protein
MTATNLYETDFIAWAERQAALLRTPVTERCSLALDWENLAEEIESLGQSYRRALANHVRKAIKYLLKLQAAPASESRTAWIAGLDRERSEIEASLEDEPGLRPRLPEIIAKETRRAVRHVVHEFALQGDEAAVAHAKMHRRFTEENVVSDWFPPGA